MSSSVRKADKIHVVDVTKHIERSLILRSAQVVVREIIVHPTSQRRSRCRSHQSLGESPCGGRLWRFIDSHQARLERLNLVEYRLVEDVTRVRRLERQVVETTHRAPTARRRGHDQTKFP